MCLREADVVLHDRLIDLHLLEEARSDAEIINVGKEHNDQDLQQEHSVIGEVVGLRNRIQWMDFATKITSE